MRHPIVMITLCAVFLLNGCASKQDTPPSPVPAAEAGATSETKTEASKDNKQTLTAHEIGYTEDSTG